MPKLLHKADLAVGALSVFVWDHEIETRNGMLCCWTYVSRGMEKRGQSEVVFTLRRTPDLELLGFPEELFDLFVMIYEAAAKGQIVDCHGFTVFHPGTTLLRRTSDWGLMYLPAISFDGIDIPANALAAILVRDYETKLIQHGFRYRVATSMAGAYRYFPYPPWSDPDRAAMLTEECFGKSILNEVPYRIIPGITVRTAGQVSLPTELRPRMVDGQASLRGEIVLTIDRKFLPDIKAALDEVPEEGVHAWLTDPDLEAESRLYWDTDANRTVILQPPWGPGRWTTGGFIIFGRAMKELKSKVNIIEDGFVAVMESESWKKLTEALTSGLPVEIPRQGEDFSLRVEFARNARGPEAKGTV